ncbi:MAG: hypothetical protein E6J19_07580 [Chloroflexi bacterium]|nr:MAG: hypothetical protein E6J49_07230 [Chloroflexota bacterium]TMC56931.1 MAG: hypothetical protein E6J19_07580 [Chloroflexota bacterium]
MGRWASQSLTRRELIRRGAIGGAAVAIAACAPAAVAPSARPSATPKRGGTLTWAQWDKNDDLDPATPTGGASLEILGNVLDTLILMDDDQKAYPLLATEWKSDPDAKRFTFTLRDDVTFHDGSRLDSSAVKRTWDRILDPKTKSTVGIGLFGPVDRIDAPDPRTVIVSFKQPYPFFPQQLWRPYLGILSPKQLDSLKPGDKVVTPIGSGPYRLSSRSADGVVTLTANADYKWGAALLRNQSAPYLDSLKFRAVAEPGTRVATLESGEYLLIDELPEPDYARLRSDARFTFVETVRRGIPLGFFVNVQRPPTNDLAVRQAMNWAVDRKNIVDKVFFGVHRPSVGPLTQGVWSYLAELENRYTFDPKKAQQVLDDAGWKQGSGPIREKGGQKLSLVLASFREPWSTIADALQSQFRDVGIDLMVQKMERGPYLDFIRSTENKHNLAASAGGGFDPDQLRERYHSSAIRVTNFANVGDPQLDAALEQGSRLPLGSAERRKAYEDAQRRLMDLVPFVSVLTQVRVEAMARRLHDLRMGPDGLNALPLSDAWLEG